MKKCLKITYDTVGEANKDARRILKDNGTVLRVYRCPKCKLYHLTSQEPIKTKPIEEQFEKFNKDLRGEISLKNNLIDQLNKELDNKTIEISRLKKRIKLERDRFTLKHRIEDEFFKDKPEILKEWIQLNIDNPFIESE